ncbi:hypothetical protein vBPaeMUSP18_54 [Pseudomonas phage vB_PaeM_USP_18]|nr:hypothetical protein vBPaeMUSP18_54 [Pseudomonas phage vB_PaeM_USP_18]QLI49514.1 hypothetical protein vBPaeMUSP25_54 [Pseudomonas phage vB_PaeM_USP_25]
MAMKQVELPMFLFRKADGTEKLCQYDHTDNGRNQYWLNDLGACMGRVVVVGEYEDIEGDPREKLIEGLEKAVEKERVESQVRVNLLLEKISQLKCLTHDTADQ